MYTVVKWFGVAEKAKITCFKHGKPTAKRGIRLPFDDDEPCNEEGRLAASISRTRARIYELAACNRWDWFFTGTLNPEWNNVNDLSAFRKKFTQGLRDFRKSSGCEVRYLLIPERHKSGAWHVHGLFSGLPVERLHHFTADETLPYRLLDRIKAHDDVYSWDWYSKRFGFTTLTPLRNAAATAAYVTKYITKDLMSHNLDSNAHSYYASIGLKGADVIAVGDLPLGDIPVNSYENDYVFTCFADSEQTGDVVAKLEQID